MTLRAAAAPLLLAALSSCAAPGEPAPALPPPPESAVSPSFAGRGLRPVEADPRERHLRNLRQVTFEGENAEAYWSADGTRLTLQHRGAGVPADQIYTVRADGTDLRLVSTGFGKTTCSYFLHGDRDVLFASTHAASLEPPPPPDMSHGYVWAIYPGFDIFVRTLEDGRLRRLTDSPGYDAEAVVSPDGTRIAFTSERDGDLDVYTMNADGSDVRRVTDALGYDGGAFFSPDGKRLVYRAFHPAEGAETDEYRRLLAQHLIRPSTLEIWTCDADGSNRLQVTSNGKANFAPYFLPDGRRIVFSSNVGDPKGREFDLYLVNDDGTGLERVTYSPEFDGFPMLSPDGKTLALCSNRFGAEKGNTNLFLADWVE
jgi:Tol biopolymer transport system component